MSKCSHGTGLTCGHCDRITYETIEPCICVPEPDSRAEGVLWALDKLREDKVPHEQLYQSLFWSDWLERIAKDNGIL